MKDGFGLLEQEGLWRLREEEVKVRKDGLLGYGGGGSE